jgi:hypothetical protein
LTGTPPNLGDDMADDPHINDRFPIGESLSPPIIRRPVPECAEAVYVSGFVPHATVRVFAGGTELLAEEKPPFGFAEMILARQVQQGESLTATQSVGALTSPPSAPPVIVSPIPASAVRATKPDVADTLFECGRVVPVGNLVPGVRVRVFENAIEVGVAPVAQTSASVLTQPLHANGSVSARQVACEGTSDEIVGPDADPVIVQSAPSPTPPPRVDPGSLIAGNDVVTLTELLVGAGVEIFDNGSSVLSGWLANASANWFPVSPPLKATSLVTATQELCGNVSNPSDPVPPAGELTAPVVVGPICEGARFVLVRRTTINATVVVLRNGSPVAYGGAAPGDVVLALGGNAALQTNDVITAVQYMGPTISPFSAPLTVVRRLHQPEIEILGGDPFLVAKGGEQPIDGPVFPRGRGGGPQIRVQTCCDEPAKVKLLGPDGNPADNLILSELFPGYFTTTWPWTSAAGWPVPDGLPVGRYSVVAATACDQRPAAATFYVIFDPNEVGGPPRFSFDDTAVWFGTGSNSIRGLHYYLHPSDARVFSIAAAAVNGMTSSFAAAGAVARAEEQLFAYSLSYHTQDVVDLITNFTEAQCADDACCLTGLLRAVGIPAHPATADAGLETGAANWTFDTWVEFLADDGGGVEWRIFHPHEYPGMLPEIRSTFGTTRGVATKGFNDLIVMANEQWVGAQLDDGSNDANYGRNSCQEPQQQVTRAFWIDELCEQGYWPIPHWDCTGVRSGGLRAGDGLRLAEGRPSFGGTLTGSVHLVNDDAERRFGRMTIELIGHRVESKAFTEETYDELTVPLVLEPGASIAVPFQLSLPQTAPPGQDLVVRARLDEQTLLVHWLTMPSSVECQMELPTDLHEGDQVVIRATVRCVAEEPIRAVVVHLGTPYALDVTDEPQRRLGDLSPGETRTLSWTARAVTALDSGSARLAVSTANAGGP